MKTIKVTPDQVKNFYKVRGFRNNNLLNIVHSTDRWVGKSDTQTDGKFVQFVERHHGYRAAFIILHRYYYKYGLNTLEKIISRWAPEEDNNNTATYISIVMQLTGLASNKCLPPPDADKELWQDIAQAMTAVECHRSIAYYWGTVTSIQLGYDAYLKRLNAGTLNC